MKTGIHYDRVASPLGTMLLIAQGDALAGIHFEGERYEPAIGADWQRTKDHPALRAAHAQLDEYFAGARTTFDLPLAPMGTAFQRAVWAAIGTVPLRRDDRVPRARGAGRPAGQHSRGGDRDRPQSVDDRRSLPPNRRSGRRVDRLRGRARPQARAAGAGGAHGRLGTCRLTRCAARTSCRLVALAAIWGASFIFVRALAPVLGPVLTATSRVVIAGIALVAYFRLTGFDAELRRHWRKFLVVGLVNSAVPFLLFAFAAVHIPASYSVILNTASPMFAALLSVVWLGERLTAMRGIGLATGAAGVALVTGAGPFVPDEMFGWAIAACLCAALCYAAGRDLHQTPRRRRQADGDRRAGARCSRARRCCRSCPLRRRRALVTVGVVANTLGLALLCSAVAYLLYYRLIEDVGPTRAMSVTFLMPLFGMVWSVLFLQETITLPMIAGCALIVGGTTLVARPARHAAIVAGGVAPKP